MEKTAEVVRRRVTPPHGRGQVKSNTLTCTPHNNSCMPNKIAGRCEIFIVLGPRTAADQSMDRKCSTLLLVIPP